VVFQAAEAFRLFTGVQPDADRMYRHFATLVDEDYEHPVNAIEKTGW
jgi:shikimate dehydrogenase